MPFAFKKALESGKFVVTCEAAPSKGTNLDTMMHHVELLKDKVDAMNVTDHQSSVMRYPSLGGAILVKEMGGEPILQMTCRDRNRLALQADLLFAASRGVHNVLCLTGDSVMLGDHKEAKPVFDLDSSQLVAAIRTLERGKDMAGNELDGGVRFCAGALSRPKPIPSSPSSLNLRKNWKRARNLFRPRQSMIWIISSNSWRTPASFRLKFWPA